MTSARPPCRVRLANARHEITVPQKRAMHKERHTVRTHRSIPCQRTLECLIYGNAQVASHCQAWHWTTHSPRLHGMSAHRLRYALMMASDLQDHDRGQLDGNQPRSTAALSQHRLMLQILWRSTRTTHSGGVNAVASPTWLSLPRAETTALERTTAGETHGGRTRVSADSNTPGEGFLCVFRLLDTPG